jgi:hypothetical protein
MQVVMIISLRHLFPAFFLAHDTIQIRSYVSLLFVFLPMSHVDYRVSIAVFSPNIFLYFFFGISL